MNISKKITFWTLYVKGSRYKGGTLTYFYRKFLRIKNINLPKTKLILHSPFYRDFEMYIFVWISQKNYFLKSLLEGWLIHRGYPYLLLLKISKKKNINFAKTKFILHSIFYRDFKMYIFVWISPKKLLFEPSISSVFDTKAGPLPTFIQNFKWKKY